jgi:hypothetical protein
MKTVTILALETAMSVSVMGPMDIFSQVGFTYNYLMGFDPKPFFDVKIASLDGKPVTFFNNVQIIPHCGVEDVSYTDLLIIPSFLDFNALTLRK